jgi:prephenate dehydrogenase
MTTAELLKNKTIAIWGLGLMGGSFALALSEQCQKLIGIDSDAEAIQYANATGVTDIATVSPEPLAEADVVILSAPVKIIMEQTAQLPALIDKSTIVMDIGSTKSDIVSCFNKLPSRFDPIGGHPMCGTEKASLWNASKDLFQGTTFALTPLERTSQNACQLAEALVNAIGAKPVYLDPARHDQWVASTSHLAYLISSVYTKTVSVEAAALAGPGFISTSRLAESPAEMMWDILTTNRKAILKELRLFQKKINDLEKILADNDDQALKQILSDAAASRRRILQKREERI